MPFISAKSQPCHGPWPTSLTAKTCRGTKRVPDALVGAGQLGEITPTENIGLPGSLGLGVGLTTPPPIKKSRNLQKEKPDRSAKDDIAKYKGLKSCFMECVIVISIGCPEGAIITTRLI